MSAARPGCQTNCRPSSRRGSSLRAGLPRDGPAAHRRLARPGALGRPAPATTAYSAGSTATAWRPRRKRRSLIAGYAAPPETERAPEPARHIEAALPGSLFQLDCFHYRALVRHHGTGLAVQLSIRLLLDARDLVAAAHRRSRQLYASQQLPALFLRKPSKIAGSVDRG